MIQSHWSKIPEEKDIRSMYPEHEYCIFDMDGTLIDSEPAHIKALQKVAHKHSSCDWNYEKMHDHFSGKADQDVYHTIDKNFNFRLSLVEFFSLKNEILLKEFDYLASKEMLIKDEIKNLLSTMYKKNWKLALVTASEDPLLQKILDYLGRDLFKFSLSTKDTERSKPFPDPYLKAFKLFGNIAPKEVLIFEDSETGLQAAISSKAVVNKVTWFNI